MASFSIESFLIMIKKTASSFITKFAQELTGNSESISLRHLSEIISLLQQIRAYLRDESPDRTKWLVPQIVELNKKISDEPDAGNLKSYLEEFINHESAAATDLEAPIRSWEKEKLGKNIRAVPSMMEEQSLKYYKWLGSEVSGSGEIVKLGCWLGASTCCLAEGISKNKKLDGKIFAFDSFRWEDWMFQYLDAGLRKRLKPASGNCYLKDFDHFCKPYRKFIVARKGYLYLDNEAGALEPFFWDDKPIKIYSYGLSGDYAYVKKAWDTFSHAFLPNETIVVFEEYGNLQAAGLRFFCRENAGLLIPLHKPFSAAKAFRYIGR